MQGCSLICQLLGAPDEFTAYLSYTLTLILESSATLLKRIMSAAARPNCGFRPNCSAVTARVVDPHVTSTIARGSMVEVASDTMRRCSMVESSVAQPALWLKPRTCIEEK